MTKFMILTKYAWDGPPMEEWEPEDIKAHLDRLHAINTELIERGEMVSGMALTGPELAKIVVSDGEGPPVVTDGPFAEVKEMLAGYQMVDVESEERALEIAALVSAVPGPGGLPVRQPMEVRQVFAPVPGVDV